MSGKGTHPAGSAKEGVSGEPWPLHTRTPGGGAGGGSPPAAPELVPGGGAGRESGADEIGWPLDLLK